MVVNKASTYALLVAVTLVPWNATAVNRYGVDSLLPSVSDTNTLKQLMPNTLHEAVAQNPANANAFNRDLSNNFAESMLVKSLLAITRGQHKEALVTVDELLRVIPNFKLAHLVRGDLLMAQAQRLQAFGNANPQSSAAIQDFQEEARSRIARYLSNQAEQMVPDLLIAPNNHQPHIMVVDTDKSRLYVYKNQAGKLTYLHDFYVTVGKNGIEKHLEGDKRTPLGVYFTRPKLTQALPDLYGNGAYPLNYPNEWDNTQNRKGSGIWLHGTPSDTYSRAPRASDGCVVLTNQDLNTLAPVLQSGKTPIIITKNLNWLTQQEVEENNKSQREKQALDEAVQKWLSDWRAQNTVQYLAHYSKDFSTNGINYQQWAEHKYRVQANKPEIKIDIRNVSMFAYPDADKKLVVVDFMQDFKSPYLSNQMQKRQYWQLENNIWKIVYEGAT